MSEHADADFRVHFVGRIGGEKVELRRVVASTAALESLKRRLARRGERIVRVERRDVGPWQPYETAAGR